MTATKRKPKPITANPLFPLVTALWFATLLGLGSFATAPALLEGPVVALGIPAWIPAAAPPLGFTTRAIFAVAMLGLGAVFGYNLGKFLGRDKTASPVRARGPVKKDNAAASAQAWRPINASEDLGAPLDAPVTDDASPRRRALTQSDEASGVATPAFIASPADHAPVFKERQEFQPSAVQNTAPPSDKVADPLGLDLFLEEASATDPAPFMTSPPAFAAPQEAPEYQAAIAQFEPDDAGFANEPASDGYGTSFDPVTPPPFEPVMETVEAAEPQLVEPEPVQPTRFQQAFAQPAPAQPMPFLQARAVDALPIDRAPLDNLGLVQLVERLALAISRRAAPAERFEPAQPKLSELKMAEPVMLEPVMAEPMMPEVSWVEPSAPAFTAPAPSEPEFVVSAPMATPVMARFEKTPSVAPLTELSDGDADSAFGAAPFKQGDAPSIKADAPEQPERIIELRPSALQPLPSFADLALDPQASDDEPEPEHDAGLERFLRMSPLLARKSDQIAEAFGVTHDTAPEPEVAEECYPSLLDMAPVVQRREPLRIEDSAFEDDAIIEPAVVFPGQDAPWSAQAARVASMPSAAISAAASSAAASPAGLAPSRPFERPSVIPVAGSPLASPGRAAPSSQVSVAQDSVDASQPLGMPDAEEADRALRAALATLQRMTARG